MLSPYLQGIKAKLYDNVRCTVNQNILKLHSNIFKINNNCIFCYSWLETNRLARGTLIM